MSTYQRAYLEMLPALVLTGLGALGSGALLGYMTPELEATPGLLIMVPGLMAFRGDIYATMGSRLSSAVHLGLLDPDDPWGDVAQVNVLASLALSLIIAAAVGLMGWGVSVLLGLPAAPLSTFLIVAVATGFISGFALALITLFIVLSATWRGIDPDNVTGPLLTTVGDVTTLGILFAVLGVI